MRMLFVFLCALVFNALFLNGQTTSADTTILKVVDVMPRFPGCEHIDTTDAGKLACSQQELLRFIYERIRYPELARQQNIEGTVVVSFVVEVDGSISNATVVRGIGGGADEESLAVVNGMNAAGKRWTPGIVRGMPVRTQFNLPIKFKLEDPDPFILIGRDTIYTDVEVPLSFKGGGEALEAWIDSHLNYPEKWLDSCRVGQMDVQVLVQGNGVVRIIDLTDYNELGPDFWSAATDALTSTYGQWTPALFNNRPVNTAFELTLTFAPKTGKCAAAKTAFEAAHAKANQGVELFNNGETEQGLALMSQAVAAFPRDAQLLMLRGRAYLSSEHMAEACQDLWLVKQIALVDWFDTVLPLICR